MSEKTFCAHDLAQALESWADPAFAESYDNVGLQVGSATQIIRRVLIALDLTPGVVEEAIQKECSMILTHHPLLFHSPSRILEGDFIGQLILRLAKENITLYSIHTNLDAAHGGVSIALAEILGLHRRTFLNPSDDGTFGMGAIGHLPEPEPLRSFLDRVHARLKTPALRYAGSDEAPIKTVAVCGGSGGGLIQAALDANADVYVTADLGYHRFFEILGPDGNCQMALVDAGHYETEKHTEQLLYTWLTERFPTIKFYCTSTPTTPTKISIR